MFFRIIGTTVCCFGKILSAAAQITFGVTETLLMLELNNNSCYLILANLAFISTIFSRSYTRIPAVWKQFDLTKEQENIWQLSNITWKKIITILTIISGLLTGLAISIQAYIGIKWLIKQLIDFNKYNINFISEIFAIYCALSSLFTFYIFVVKNSIHNTNLLLESISNINICNLNSQIITPICKTFLVSFLGAFSYGSFAYFNIKIFLNDHLHFKHNNLICIISSIFLLARFYSTIMSRVAETFKFFMQPNAISYDILDDKNKKLFYLLFFITMIDVMSYFSSYTYGSYDLMTNISDNQIAIKIIAITTAISAGYLHYIFSIRRKILLPIMTTWIQKQNNCTLLNENLYIQKATLSTSSSIFSANNILTTETVDAQSESQSTIKMDK